MIRALEACPTAMSKTDRRDFIRNSALTGAVVATGSLLGGRAARAQEKGQDEPAVWTADLGKVRELNEKHPVLVKALFKDEEGTVVAEEKIFVRWEKINEYAGRWIVLSAICQHLKCKVDFSAEEHKYICPCHGSEYDLEGNVLKRPTRHPLPDYSDMVEDVDGRLILTRPAE